MLKHSKCPRLPIQQPLVVDPAANELLRHQTTAWTFSISDQSAATKEDSCLWASDVFLFSFSFCVEKAEGREWA